jgi:hypothetical protein
MSAPGAPSPLSVVLVGLGPIGVEVGRALLMRRVPLLAAVDPAPGKAGADVGELFGGAARGERVVARAVDAYAATSGPGRVAVLCTGSRLSRVAVEIEEAIDAGLHVVSTCEELAYPALHHAALGRRLDERARAAGVAVLGTGVNPGLVMDRLPLAIATACARVDRVRVERVVDAARRRGPLRAKVGAGISVDMFRQGVDAGHLGHVGLAESCALLARGLGIRPDRVVETIDPVVAQVATAGVAAGLVLGVRQRAVAIVSGNEVVRLDLTMAVGSPDPHDRIVIEGDPPIDVRVTGGLQGDRATVGTVVNALAEVVKAPPGLHNVTSLPLFGLGV